MTFVEDVYQVVYYRTCGNSTEHESNFGDTIIHDNSKMVIDCRCNSQIVVDYCGNSRIIIDYRGTSRTVYLTTAVNYGWYLFVTDGTCMNRPR